MSAIQRLARIMWLLQSYHINGYPLWLLSRLTGLGIDLGLGHKMALSGWFEIKPVVHHGYTYQHYFLTLSGQVWGEVLAGKGDTTLWSSGD